MKRLLQVENSVANKFPVRQQLKIDVYR